MVELPIALVVIGGSAASLCDFCGHHYVHHFRGESAVPCAYQLGGTDNIAYHDCRCGTFCKGYRPRAGGDGLTCVCGVKIFDHISTQKNLNGLFLSHADKLAHTSSRDRPYKVHHHGMKLCCLWAIDYHISKVSDEEYQAMRPGYAIKCPVCAKLGKIQVVPSTFVIGPTWRWFYSRD